MPARRRSRSSARRVNSTRDLRRSFHTGSHNIEEIIKSDCTVKDARARARSPHPFRYRSCIGRCESSIAAGFVISAESISASLLGRAFWFAPGSLRRERRGFIGSPPARLSVKRVRRMPIDRSKQDSRVFSGMRGRACAK
jgi:hypothetical protein